MISWLPLLLLGGVTFAPPLPPDALSPACPALYHLQHPAECAASGPVNYARGLQAAGLPFPLPPIPITPTRPYRGLTPDAYARVVTETTPVYRHPLEALAGLTPTRFLEKGYVFVSVQGEAFVNGEKFYQINASEYLRAAALKEARPSAFQGIHFSTPPSALFGWIVVDARPSPAPGVPPLPETRYIGHYHPFQVQAVQRVGDWDWYQIGPDQWLEQRAVGIVSPTPPPGAPPEAIVVNTYEQTLSVYQHGALTFATLISSGSRTFPTRPGTFTVWAKLYRGKMSGAYLDDQSDYYFLEDVPWILYYDGDRALHGAYWHDTFGVQHSHGCVNLSPRDAQWLYDHTSVGATVMIINTAP